MTSKISLWRYKYVLSTMTKYWVKDSLRHYTKYRKPNKTFSFLNLLTFVKLRQYETSLVNKKLLNKKQNIYLRKIKISSICPRLKTIRNSKTSTCQSECSSLQFWSSSSKYATCRTSSVPSFRRFREPPLPFSGVVYNPNEKRNKRDCLESTLRKKG